MTSSTMEANGTTTDGDGYGDNPNGSNADLFPNDSTEWYDTDGDGYGNNAADAFPTDGTQWNDTDDDGYGDNPNGTNADISQTIKIDGAIQMVTRIPTRKTMTHSRMIHHNGMILMETAMVTMPTDQTLICSRTILQNGTMLTAMV